MRRYTASNVIIFLIGNKNDEEELREVEFAEAEALCQYIPEIRLCMETSAKDNRNITEAFMNLATELKVREFCASFIALIAFLILFLSI